MYLDVPASEELAGGLHQVPAASRTRMLNLSTPVPGSTLSSTVASKEQTEPWPSSHEPRKVAGAAANSPVWGQRSITAE
jgi:hypothetical protein